MARNGPERTKTPSPPADERTALALRRTIFATDRTLLAWIRSSLSLMTFGFTIYKFFQYLQDSGATTANWQPVGPRRFGLILVGLATVLMIWQVVEYYRFLKRVTHKQGKQIVLTPSMAAASATILLGIATFITILTGTNFV